MYNTTTKKSRCDCDIQQDSITNSLQNINFDTNKFGKEFFNTIERSNFQVLKCYKVPIDTKNIFKNIGRIIMTFIYIFYLICFFVFIFKERTKIYIMIKTIIKNKKNDYKKPGSSQDKKDKKKRIKKNSPKNIEYKPSLINSNEKINNNINIKANPVNKNIYKKKSKSKNKNKSKDIKIYNDEKDNADNDKDNSKNLILDKSLNDEELNSLNYDNAIKIDKRTYLQYYWSLLKKKQLILFTFIPSNDYNLISIKISLFLLSFSLYFAINAFFFSDSTMNKLTEDNGYFDILYQIPQIIYSSLISAFTNILLKFLSLSEKNILIIKQENSINKAYNEIKHVKRIINIKFILFFIIGNLLFLFYWYFISCFCGVFINTQIILFKDTIISFCLSMIYPFGLYLLPGIFRIPALKGENNNNGKYLYQISKIIAFI